MLRRGLGWLVVVQLVGGWLCWLEIVGRGLLQYVTGGVLLGVAHGARHLSGEAYMSRVSLNCAGCECEGWSCDQCGASLEGVVCVDCMSCPEPAGYWAWDAGTLSDYLITLDRAAAHYAARGRDDIAAAIMAHHAVMGGE